MHLTLNIKEIVECFPLSVLLVVAWSVLWWQGRRRVRLWFIELVNHLFKLRGHFGSAPNHM